MVEECDFDRQFLFEEYSVISHCYEIKIVIIGKLKSSSFLLYKKK